MSSIRKSRTSFLRSAYPAFEVMPQDGSVQFWGRMGIERRLLNSELLPKQNLSVSAGNYFLTGKVTLELTWVLMFIFMIQADGVFGFGGELGEVVESLDDGSKSYEWNPLYARGHAFADYKFLRLYAGYGQDPLRNFENNQWSIGLSLTTP